MERTTNVGILDNFFFGKELIESGKHNARNAMQSQAVHSLDLLERSADPPAPTVQQQHYIAPVEPSNFPPSQVMG